MKGGFLRSTSIVGGMTLISRITGMVRDMVWAAMFGAGPVMDAFFVAFKIPNFFRRITGEGALSQAFVPVVSEYRLKRTPDETAELVAGMTGTLGVILFAISALMVVGAPVVIMLFAPGFDRGGDRHELAVEMVRWTSPYMFFISLTALAAGVLNSYGKFGWAAFNPIILNLVLIVFAAFVSPHFDEPGLALAIGVFVAGGIQLAWQYWNLKRLNLLRWPKWSAAHEGVKRVRDLMLPGIFGSSVAQVSLLLDTWITSFLMAGSFGWMYYADRLVEFPMGVFSIALATVILPGLSAHHAQDSPKHFNETLDWALRLTTLVSLPAAVGLATLAGPLTATIYGHGKFDARDVEMASYALIAYSLGLMGFSFVKVLAPGYFARQDTKAPVRAGMAALAVNMGFNVAVVVPANMAGFPAPHALLAFSTGLGAYVNTWLLYRGLRRAGVFVPSPQWRRLGVQAACANVAMAAFLWWSAGDWSSWIHWTVGHRVARLGLCIGGALVVYFGVLFALGLRYRHLRVQHTP